MKEENTTKNYLISFLIVIFIIYVLLIGTKFCFGESNCFFTWDQNIESDLAGYRMYRSNESGKYVFGEGNEAGNVTTDEVILDSNSRVLFELSNIPDGENFFVVTAYDITGNESPPSNEVFDTFDTTPPNSPGSLDRRGCLPVF